MTCEFEAEILRYIEIYLKACGKAGWFVRREMKDYV
jgi:hypothetical protein